MKRPLLLIAMGIVFGVAVSFWFGLIGILAYGIIMLLCILQKKIKFVIVLYISISFLVGFFLTNFSLSTIQKQFSYLSHQTLTYEGTVKNLNIYENYIILTIDQLKYQSEDYLVNGKISLIIDASSMEKRISYGDVIGFDAELKRPPGPNNPGGFNERLYNYGKGIYYSGYAEQITILKQEPSLFKLIINSTRRKLIDIAGKLWTSDTLDMVETMVFGESDAIDPSIKAIYQNVGLAHVLAISGLHLSIIVLGIYKLIKKTMKPYSEIIMIIFMVFYIDITNVHISTVRAGLMVGMFLISCVLLRRYDPISSIAGAVIVILLVNPFQLFQVGFLLSVSAVIGLIVLGPLLEKLLKERFGNRYLWQLIAPLVGIQLMTLPIQLYYFYGAPIYAVLINIVVIPFVLFFLVLSIISILVGLCYLPFGYVLARISELCHHIIFSIARLVNGLPFNYICFGRPNIIIIISYYIILLLILCCLLKLEVRNTLKNFNSSIIQTRYFKVIVITFILVILVVTIVLYNRVTIINFDVGQGDSAMITYHNKAFLIDAGGDTKLYGRDNVGRTVILPYMKSKGVNQLEAVFISHSHFDHIYGLIELIPLVRIKHVYLPAAYQNYEDSLLCQLKELMKSYNIPYSYLASGDRVVYDQLTFNCLYPFNDEVLKDNNDQSLVIKLSKGRFDYIFTGDIGTAVEAAIMNSDILYGIEGLKIAHHGSNSSSQLEFLEAINPSFSLVSYGEYNFYGHPSDITLRNLELIDTNIYKTAEDGALSVYYDGFMVYYMDSMYNKGKDYYLCKP